MAAHHLQLAAELIEQGGEWIDRAWDDDSATETDDKARAVLADLADQADVLCSQLRAVVGLADDVPEVDLKALQRQLEQVRDLDAGLPPGALEAATRAQREAVYGLGAIAKLRGGRP